jgi:hypothetical protein
MASASQPKIKVKGSGQECPPHTQTTRSIRMTIEIPVSSHSEIRHPEASRFHQRREEPAELNGEGISRA